MRDLRFERGPLGMVLEAHFDHERNPYFTNRVGACLQPVLLEAMDT